MATRRQREIVRALIQHMGTDDVRAAVLAVCEELRELDDETETRLASAQGLDRFIGM